MLSHAPHKNFFFNQDIFESGMIFGEIFIKRDLLIEDFGGCARYIVAAHVSAFLTPVDVSRLAADRVLRHLEGVPYGNAVGQEPPGRGLCDISQGAVCGTIVEPRVMGDNRLYIVLAAKRGDVAAGGLDGDDFPGAGLDVGLILRPLGGVIRSIEQTAVSAEHFINNEAESLEDVPLLVVDGAADVVHHGIFQAVGRFRVNGEIIGLALVVHVVYLFS